MINYSINYNENKNIYFSIIINNNAIISKDYFVDWNILNKIVEKKHDSTETLIVSSN